MATVAIAKNLRRSRMIPTMPNTKAAGTEIFMINPTRVLAGLPQPGLSIMLALPVRANTTSNITAIFPKRISSLSKKNAKEDFQYFNYIGILFAGQLINRRSFQVAGIASASGYADAVEIVEKRDGVLSGSIKKILELYTFQLAFLIDERD